MAWRGASLRGASTFFGRLAHFCAKVSFFSWIQFKWYFNANQNSKMKFIIECILIHIDWNFIQQIGGYIFKMINVQLGLCMCALLGTGWWVVLVSTKQLGTKRVVFSSHFRDPQILPVTWMYGILVRKRFCNLWTVCGSFLIS